MKRLSTSFATMLVLCTCHSLAQAENAAPLRVATAPAAYALAATAPAIERQEIRAQLMPRRYTTVAAEIGAKINRIPLAEGSAFKAGQLLVSFDCSLQHAQLQKAQAELDGAAQTLKSNQRLAELNSVGQLDLDLSRSAVNKARAEIGANQAVMAKCSVAAPFAGRVAEQKVREQQFVQAGQPLLDIIDDSVLELEFLVPSRWLGWLRVGSAFQVQIDETGKTYPAKFIRIGARVDPVSQSVKVAAAIDGRFLDLMAGMSGRVQVRQP
ncbi:efflux RND transporter periplasmic adaptor subunit [Noviherbaspirillum sp. L7-7A]|uniref:efflux RND transporter periplasmic adaptor subunit n=1 Tax=Noviherbaspirillum sp. L7-7A TaxID=2850560 RepID=UPI00201179BD|nr:efflux RND transporter periplasmic adaptor subunit [Noviherbaspirillum sp. L7-7A]